MIHQLSIVKFFTVRHCYNYKKFYVSLIMVMTKWKPTIVRKRKRKKLMSIITKKIKSQRKTEREENRNKRTTK